LSVFSGAASKILVEEVPVVLCVCSARWCWVRLESGCAPMQALDCCSDLVLDGLVLLLRRSDRTVVFVGIIVGDQPIVYVLLLDEYTFFWFVGHVDSCLLSDHVHAVRALSRSSSIGLVSTGSTIVFGCGGP
jgi:hypothetical protein